MFIKSVSDGAVGLAYQLNRGAGFIAVLVC